MTTTPAYRSQLGELTDDARAWQRAAAGNDPTDRRDGAVYEASAELRLAVDVAMATGRPLLLRGEPGSGKSSLAGYVARNLGWRYYEHVVTSTTAAEDLLWRFDAVRRLSDAQVEGRPIDDERYIEPGPLWWVIDPGSAARRGAADADVPDAVEPLAALNAHRAADAAVVLIDELDKADPDLPNGLLVPLGSRTFTVAETGFVVGGPGAALGRRMLVIITTNEERQLPPALLRRCIVHRIETPDLATLVRIACLHLLGPGSTPSTADEALFRAVAERLTAVRTELAGTERLPSTAEYLDAVRACRELGVAPKPSDPTWSMVERVTLSKTGPRDDRARG